MTRQTSQTTVGARLRNPYRNARGEWVRGNFHGHSAEGSHCASVPLLEGVRRYHDVGCRFMAVTDHDFITDLGAVRAAHPDMVFLSGFEYSKSENFLFIGENLPALFRLKPRAAMEHARHLLTIICHPQLWGDGDYWNETKIMALGRLPTGIEIFNGHYDVPRMRARGSTADYTAFWDQLLTHGHRLWGFANDDFHDPEDFNNAFNVVSVEELTAAAVLEAARNGHCYGSTGLMLDRVEDSEGRIQVTVGEPCTGRFIGPGGRTLAESNGTAFEYTVSSEAYVRFEAANETGRLYLQPMFVDPEC